MKPSGYLLIAILYFFSIQTIYSQTKNTPWTTSFGTNVVNNPVRSQIIDKGRFKTWNWNAAGFRLATGRLLTNKISLEAVASLNTVSENYEHLETNYTYISFDGMFRYQLTKGLDDLDPYITLGGGYTWLDKIGAGTANIGGGINLWVSPKFGFNIQTVYKYAFEEYGLQHFQHSAGMVFRFGGIDSDNDGINDDKDRCPELFGIIEANGCPDSDGDSVIDSEDLCPNSFGPPELRGCPDNDGDGTPDKYDKCPKLPGAINDDGCPFQDFDRDGIADNLDKCPQLAGVVENNGCPLEKPNQAQQAALQQQRIMERNAAIKNDITIKLSALAKAISFNNADATLTVSDKNTLNNIVAIMNEQSNMTFHIAGHTDDTGSKTTNLNLSEKRANKVKQYLITKGINNSRLSSQGYGEENPIADNSTKEGRLKNRRVEIFITN